MSAKEFSETEIKDAVKSRYAKAIQGSSSCCGPTTVEQKGGMVKIADYDKDDLSRLPADAVQNSFGCVTPLAFAGVQPGQVVLDIGSGAGIDCFIAAEKVGPTGKVIGLDMTPEMIERARENAKRLNVTNVEFRQGYLENLPVEDASIDVVISNCVVNLTPDKFVVFKEIARVLKPGKRLAISDVVSNGPVPDVLRKNVEAWGACLGGALEVKEWERGLTEAGFESIQLEPKDAGGKILSALPIGVPFSAQISAVKRLG